MAKSVDIDALSRKIIADAKNGDFAPIYLLMGAESFYPDLVADAIIKNAVQEEFRDFNQTIFYGTDTDAATVASESRLYPMMAERRLVVLKEVQNLRSFDALAAYCEEPMDTTVLLIVMHEAVADKRKSFYKNVLKKGIVLESPLLRDYEIGSWIKKYYSGLRLGISEEAVALLGEFTGASLSRIALETEKLQKSLPEGTAMVQASDIEKNVGMSRQYSVFELTKALSFKDSVKALRIASNLGSAAKFAMPMAVSALFLHFYRILKYEALLLKDKNPDSSKKAQVLGVAPFFFKEYDVAVTKYPIRKCMSIIDLLENYDFKGKGGDVGEVSDGALLTELVIKILN